MPEPSRKLIHGDCLDVLPGIESGTLDVVLTDPPYPCIKRSYGTWTEAGWWELMRAVVPECMRILKPTGSAVFVLQPNSERVGRMRTWLWEFVAWVGREWGVVQDAYWWNHATLPNGGSTTKGLLRSSVKACVWVGAADCYRNQDTVLLPCAPRTQREQRLTAKRGSSRISYPSGNGVDHGRCSTASLRRGGTTPFNMLACTPGGPERMAAKKHPAATPLQLVAWWTRYLCPPGGVVCDPFAGTATVGSAALKHGASFVGIERDSGYCEIARERLEAAAACAGGQ